MPPTSCSTAASSPGRRRPCSTCAATRTPACGRSCVTARCRRRRSRCARPSAGRAADPGRLRRAAEGYAGADAEPRAARGRERRRVVRAGARPPRLDRRVRDALLRRPPRARPGRRHVRARDGADLQGQGRRARRAHRRRPRRDQRRQGGRRHGPARRQAHAPAALRRARGRPLAAPGPALKPSGTTSRDVCQVFRVRGVRRVALIVVLWLGVPAVAGAATPVKLGDRPLLALAARDGEAYAVIESGDPARPFAFVRTGARAQEFGGPGAESPEMVAGREGVEIAGARQTGSGRELFETAADRVGGARAVATGTGPPQLDEDGTLAYPDRDGDVVKGDARLTQDAPEHRHLPLDAAAGVVLDLDQRRTVTQLRLLGPNAPNAPALSLPRLADVQASLAVAGDRAYVAYALEERIYLATADLDSQARWSTRRLANDGAGRPAVARAQGRTFVAFSRAGGVYLNGKRLGSGGGPLPPPPRPPRFPPRARESAPP